MPWYNPSDCLRTTRALSYDGHRMEVVFANEKLDRLETDRGYLAGYSREIVRAYRKRLQLIRGAQDERDLRAFKSLHFEKLKGKRSDQHSLRLNDQWRLIIRIENVSGQKRIRIIGIEDYHT